ncbi:MAG: S-methyl-5-thioribose-1-phosphate isomerase [Synergistaceae bacterium]|jgi:methylthioribose-1-phosphate isomerase|nr:S-methyl-5-thioribose-1-phosphate isomerase [Synergistaceae bacterium]
MSETKFPTDEEAVRDIGEIGRRMYAKNFVAANDGNISCRVAPDVIWTTPTGVSKGFMTEGSMVKMRLDGTVLASGPLEPSSEVKMHLRLYNENEAIMGVTHAHPPVCTSFAVAGQSLDSSAYPEALVNLGVVPCVHYETPGSRGIPDSIAPYCRDYNALLLSNHGALSWGTSLMEAFFRLEAMEHYATILMYTGYIIGQANALTESQVGELLDIRARLGVTSGGVPSRFASLPTNDRDVAPLGTAQSMTKSLLDRDTVSLDEENRALVIIDQTKLPGSVELLSLTRQEEIHRAIYGLQVRGAPAIGVAAAIGVYLAACEIDSGDYETFYEKFKQAKDYLATSRPTAVNLFWALDRMERVASANSRVPVGEIKRMLHDEAILIRNEDVKTCRAIGEYGLALLKDGDGILTHCNAGQLATVKYGTALAPIHLGAERGYRFRVYADETRPLLQGARLTASELVARGVETTVICDGMASSVMKKGWIDAVFVGCDRVAANGDVCNKIGTSGVAIMAKYYGIPFYVCAPTSTIDMATPDGSGIVIEERPPEEVTEMWYRERMAPEGAGVYNPAFDVTDHELVTAIITERGVLTAPYGESLKNLT